MNTYKLFIVSTPIGNLKDITIRAKEVLQESEAIVCENYSTAKKLFQLLEINSNKPFFVFADINAKRDLQKAIEFIKQHKNVALISEAGTPLINDPGFELVREIRENLQTEIEIVTIPGPSSLLAHLCISGLPTDKFMFLGFLPKTSGKRESAIKRLKQINEIEKTTFVLFESKYKILDTLKLLNRIYPNCNVSVGNELTKMYEKVYFGTPEKVLSEIKNPRGEFIIHILL
ncbi:16S rRNA (cytidine(1402)-2'-O)-methyltransferase [Patescibacteria group bacterium]|nr:16S rRNA (cytidine(1402)-2'-O)-methyltransferase [Patescibacteria group bacterium]